jgi:hypothetical protein
MHSESVQSGGPTGGGEHLLPVPDEAVIYKAVSDGGVLLHTATEVYFGLNRVGARVWELLPPASRTFDELCPKIIADYPDAAPETVRNDVAELLSELVSHGLATFGDVRTGGGAGPPGPAPFSSP